MELLNIFFLGSQIFEGPQSALIWISNFTKLENITKQQIELGFKPIFHIPFK